MGLFEMIRIPVMRFCFSGNQLYCAVSRVPVSQRHSSSQPTENLPVTGVMPHEAIW